MKEKLPRLILTVALVLLVAAWIYGYMTSGFDVSSHLEEIFPGATEFKQVSNAPIVYEAYRGAELLGYAAVDSAMGYEAQVYMLVQVDTEGIIQGVRPVQHREWPTWWRMLISEGFFSQFLGKAVNADISIIKDIEAVSGATYSSRGVAGAIRHGSHYLSKNVFGWQTPPEPAGYSFGYGEAALLLMYGLVLLAWRLRKPKLRWVTILMGIGVLGFWLKSPITFANIAGVFIGSFPPLAGHILWYLLILGIPALILVTGQNVYCYWICPFGGVQEVLAQVSGGAKYGVKGKVKQAASYLRHLLFWLALMAAFLTFNPAMGDYTPFSTLFGLKGGTAHWLLLPLALLVSMFSYRFWCRHFCPGMIVFDWLALMRRKGAYWWKTRETKTQSKTLSSESQSP